MALKDYFKGTSIPKSPDLPERIEGEILHCNEEGFGFIESKSIPFERIYFRWTALNQKTLKFLELKKGMKVEFTPKKFEKGWRAIKIEVFR